MLSYKWTTYEYARYSLDISSYPSTPTPTPTPTPTVCLQKATSDQYCSIPFKYKGVTCNSCTTSNYNRPWCSLDPKYKGSWGNCGEYWLGLIDSFRFLFILNLFHQVVCIRGFVEFLLNCFPVKTIPDEKKSSWNWFCQLILIFVPKMAQYLSSLFSSVWITLNLSSF